MTSSCSLFFSWLSKHSPFSQIHGALMTGKLEAIDLQNTFSVFTVYGLTFLWSQQVYPHI